MAVKEVFFGLVDLPEVHKAYLEHDGFWALQQRDRLIDQCCEEMAELIKELMKSRRGFDGFNDRQEEIKGEMADVLIVFDFFMRMMRFPRLEMDTYVRGRAIRLTNKLHQLRAAGYGAE